MKLIHFTDTHFVPPGKELYGRDPRVALEAAVADINAEHADAELAVVTGDLTHWGEASAFAQLAEVLGKLSMPVQLLIGNHDARAVFLEHFPDQGVDPNGFVQSAIDVSAGRFLLLDTVLAGTHAGHFCETRQAWLGEQLAGAGARDLFLFMHHPPFDIGLPPADSIGLQQKAAFKDLVDPYKRQIRHLFYGHVHRPIAGNWMGISTSTVRAMNHQVAFSMEPGRLQGSFEPPAYAVVLIDPERVVVHFHDFLDDSPRFPLGDSPWNDWSRKENHVS